MSNPAIEKAVTLGNCVTLQYCTTMRTYLYTVLNNNMSTKERISIAKLIESLWQGCDMQEGKSCAILQLVNYGGVAIRTRGKLLMSFFICMFVQPCFLKIDVTASSCPSPISKAANLLAVLGLFDNRSVTA